MPYQPKPDEKPVYQIINPMTGEGLRIWQNGEYTGRQPSEGEPACLINRMPRRDHEIYERGFQEGRKAAPLLRAIRA